MLISLTIDNFKSFAEPATLSLVASKSDKTFPGAIADPGCVFSGGSKLLSAAAIYGANAAGKSNLILAADYLQDAVHLSHSTWKPDGGTKIEPHATRAHDETGFEIDFIVDGAPYQYGFRGHASHFSKEWLYSRPRGRKRTLFERETTKSNTGYETIVRFGSSFVSTENERTSLRRRTRENSLFLSVGAQENQPDCRSIVSWITSRFTIIPVTIFTDMAAAFTSRMCSEHDDFRELVLGLIQSADNGIAGISISEAESPSLSGMPEHIPPETREYLSEASRYSVEFEIGVDGERFSLPLNSQSRGVQRLYGIASAILFALRRGEVLFLDELEGSMHPHVASQILALFQSKSTNKNGAQLIFTTHDTGLLSLDRLRRDQIWFIEKENSRSHLYPLSDFSPRKDENLEAGYLRGRYGAIPAGGFGLDWMEKLARPVG